VGNIEVIRTDWLRAAMQTLIEHGLDEAKLDVLGEQLGVSRPASTCVTNRAELLDARLEPWGRTQTNGLIHLPERPAATLTEAAGKVFRGLLDPDLLRTRLNLAVRDRARRRCVSNSMRPKIGGLRRAPGCSRGSADPTSMRSRAHAPPTPCGAATTMRSCPAPMETGKLLVPAYLRGFAGARRPESDVEALRPFAEAVAHEHPV
jgi:hypothetical protein